MRCAQRKAQEISAPGSNFLALIRTAATWKRLPAEVKMENLNLYGLILNFFGAMILVASSPMHTGVRPRWTFRTGMMLLVFGFLLQLMHVARPYLSDNNYATAYVTSFALSPVAVLRFIPRFLRIRTVKRIHSQTVTPNL